MGQDKASLLWGEARAVDLVARAARAAGATRIVTVGAADLGYDHVSDEARGGPAAAVAMGVRALAAQECARVLALAVDAPTLDAADLAPLVTAPGPGAAYAHLHLPLVIDVAVSPEAGEGWSMGRFIREAGLALIEPPDEALARLRGANTPEERARLLAAHLARGAAK